MKKILDPTFTGDTVSYKGELDEKGKAYGHGIATKSTDAGEYIYYGTWKEP